MRIMSANAWKILGSVMLKKISPILIVIFTINNMLIDFLTTVLLLKLNYGVRPT